MNKNFLIIAFLFLAACSEDNKKDSKDGNTQDKIATNTGPVLSDPTPAEEINQADNKREHVNPKNEEAFVSGFKINDKDIVLGDPNSKVVVIEYYSPTCSHCAYYHKTILPEIAKKYLDTNKIAYVSRTFISNKQDLDAAILQRCPNNEKDSYLKFQSVILSQQEKWIGTKKYREILTNIGQIGGISPETYAKCLNDNETIKVLLANTNFIANTPGFVGTPAFFINGVQIDDGYSVDNLSKKIDAALNKTRSDAEK